MQRLMAVPVLATAASFAEHQKLCLQLPKLANVSFLGHLQHRWPVACNSESLPCPWLLPGVVSIAMVIIHGQQKGPAGTITAAHVVAACGAWLLCKWSGLWGAHRSACAELSLSHGDSLIPAVTATVVMPSHAGNGSHAGTGSHLKEGWCCLQSTGR
jgi:hypothetical protein